MQNEFRTVEESFRQLKQKFRLGQISQREFIDQLKNLRIRDKEGRFWMIGAQSGKWYYFDGKDWVQAHPPSLKEGRVICIYCGFENDLTAEFCARCGSPSKEKERAVCPECGHELDQPGAACPSCGPKEATSAPSASTELPAAEPTAKRTSQYSFRGFHPASFALFSGIVGFFLGIVAGAILGVTDVLPAIGVSMPSFLQELRGKLMGAILFSGFGAVLGFLALAGLGFLQAVIFNGISSLIGGISIRLEESGRKTPAQKDGEKRDRFLSLK